MDFDKPDAPTWAKYVAIFISVLLGVGIILPLVIALIRALWLLALS